MSAAELAGRRAAIVAAVGDVAPLEFVNGGGTGSLETHRRRGRGDRDPGAGPGCTSPGCSTATGLLRSAAALFALPVVRQAGAWRGHRARRRLPGLRPGQRERLPGRTCRPGSGWTARRARARCRPRCSARRADGLRIGDRVWFGTPRQASCASASASSTWSTGDAVIATRADLPRRGPGLPVADARPARLASCGVPRSGRSRCRSTARPTAAAASRTSGRATSSCSRSRSRRTLFAGLTRSASVSMVGREVLPACARFRRRSRPGPASATLPGARSPCPALRLRGPDRPSDASFLRPWRPGRATLAPSLPGSGDGAQPA